MKESYDSSSYPVFFNLGKVGKARVIGGYFWQSVDHVLTKNIAEGGWGDRTRLNDPLRYTDIRSTHQGRKLFGPSILP